MRLPDPSNGTMPSLSPWITNVGTVTLVRSSRKSVVAKASIAPLAAPSSDCLHSASAAWRCSSLTFSSSSAEKKSVVNWSKKASRSPPMPSSNALAVSSSSGPSGLSSVWAR